MRTLPLACAAALQIVALTGANAAQKSTSTTTGGNYQSMVATHAAANGVPVSLVHRVIMRESRYNPRAVSKGNYGMMQIKLATARSMGYTGTAQGLLDANTNLTYAVKYLAGAYRVAGGNQDRAVSYYARGYYYAAKQRGLTGRGARTLTASAPVFSTSYQETQPMAQPVRTTRNERRRQRVASATVTNPFASLFAQSPQPQKKSREARRHVASYQYRSASR